MVTLKEITVTRAPIERCFDLVRSIDLHTVSTAQTGEHAIGGVTSGLIGLGEEVTWRARHFGVWQTLTSRITGFSRPDYFQDTMVRGAFRSFQHDHYLLEQPDGSVEVTDVLRFAAPIPILGRVAELILKPYLRRFLQERNAMLKQVAEGEEWKSYLPAE